MSASQKCGAFEPSGRKDMMTIPVSCRISVNLSWHAQIQHFHSGEPTKANVVACDEVGCFKAVIFAIIIFFGMSVTFYSYRIRGKNRD